MAMHESKHSEAQKRRGRLYRAIEDDIVELDHQLKNRIETLKSQRDIIVATLERMVAQARTNSAITRSVCRISRA
jgi:hypothetical protein